MLRANGLPHTSSGSPRASTLLQKGTRLAHTPAAESAERLQDTRA
jgi:hypothetical protein